MPSDWMAVSDARGEARSSAQDHAMSRGDDQRVHAMMAATPSVNAWTKAADQQHSPNAVHELLRPSDVKIERVNMTLTPTSEATATDEDKRVVSALELKRLRNRECMRRSRQRKQQELDAMRTEIAELETQLRKMQIQKREAMARYTGDSDSNIQLMFDTLQQENIELRDAIREREKLREIVAPLLEQEDQRKTLDEQQRLYEEQHKDQFTWVRHVLPVLGLKSMTPEDVAKLIQTSCEHIMACANHADTCIESANLVFGWSDKRVVDDEWVHFMFSKDFVHQDIEEVMNKSWETSSNINKVTAFQPRTQHMLVLQRWGEDALVVARTLNVPQLSRDGIELEQNFCSIFLIFRIKTATGYIVGTRTLSPEPAREALLFAGEFRSTYVDLCYGLLFTPLSPESPVGCNVRFGGRAGNTTRVYAKLCAMDVLLATLRWENHCIAPLNRLTDGRP